MSCSIYFVLPPVFDIGPNLQKLGAKIVAVLDDLSTDLNAKLEDLKTSGTAAQEAILAAVNAEHDAVTKALTDLQAKLDAALASGGADPAAVQAFKDNMATSFDAIKADLDTKKNAITDAVTAIYQPPATP